MHVKHSYNVPCMAAGHTLHSLSAKAQYFKAQKSKKLIYIHELNMVKTGAICKYM